MNPGVAFYRKYTEGLLGRYVRMSMEAGKVPSLLGKDMFRGHVTSYRVDSFEDVVIFVHDIEKCLGRLEMEQQRLLSRIALQNYTIPETARMFHLRPSTILRRYHEAIDNLTRIFLDAEILQPQKLVNRAIFKTWVKWLYNNNLSISFSWSGVISIWYSGYVSQ